MDDYQRFAIRSLARARDRPYHLNHLGQPSAFYVRSVNQLINLFEEQMAKNNNRPAGGFNGGFDVTFCDVRLSQQDKTQFEQYFSQSTEELGLELGVIISKSTKLSVSWDDRNMCFIASLTCREEKSPNYNCCISSRSQDWFEAIMLSVFKATVLAGDKPWASMKSDNAWG